MRLAMFLVFALAACDDEDDGGVAGDDDDEVVLPDVDGVTFVTGVDNPFFPLPVGATWSYEGETDEGFEEVTVEVLAETEEIEGVTATVVHDVESLDGVVIEDTHDWFAQDADG